MFLAIHSFRALGVKWVHQLSQVNMQSPTKCSKHIVYNQQCCNVLIVPNSPTPVKQFRKGDVQSVLQHCAQVCYLTERSLNLRLCLHLFKSSEREFRVLSGSVLTLLRMESFSVRHRSHLRLPHLYGYDRETIDRLMMGSSPSSLHFHTYFDRHDLVCFSALLKLLLWFRNLCFHGGSVTPVYCLCLEFASVETWAR